MKFNAKSRQHLVVANILHPQIEHNNNTTKKMVWNDFKQYTSTGIGAHDVHVCWSKMDVTPKKEEDEIVIGFPSWI